MKTNNKTIAFKNKISDYDFIFKNNYTKTALYVGGALLLLYVSGKAMRIIASTVTDYKILRTAIKQ